jgi:hypothetical protein
MRSKFWAPVGVALLMGGLSSATSVRPLSLQQLSAGAEDIVYASVDKVESVWNAQKIETIVTLAPLETWKGTPSPRVQVRVPGGTVGNITMKCSEAPTFRQNDKVVCFLRSRNGAKEVYGWFRGQYTVVNEQVREIPNMSLTSFKAAISAAITTPVEGR